MIYTDNAKCGKKILYSNCEISLDYPKRYSENVDVKQVTTERKKKKLKKNTHNEQSPKPSSRETERFVRTVHFGK